MLRWTILLCAGLFLTLQLAGEDRGQKRMGILQGELDALADQNKLARASEPEVVARTEPAPRKQKPAAVEVVFSAKPALVTPQPVSAEPAPAEVIVASASSANAEGQLMYVSGRSVNVRGGPSTRNPVVGKLVRGDAVMMVWAEDNGWARIRIEGDGIDGYMSMDFLTDTPPAN